jgi:hypothetical protein
VLVVVVALAVAPPLVGDCSVQSHLGQVVVVVVMVVVAVMVVARVVVVARTAAKHPGPECCDDGQNHPVDTMVVVSIAMMARRVGLVKVELDGDVKYYATLGFAAGVVVVVVAVVVRAVQPVLATVVLVSCRIRHSSFW